MQILFLFLFSIFIWFFYDFIAFPALEAWEKENQKPLSRTFMWTELDLQEPQMEWE